MVFTAHVINICRERILFIYAEGLAFTRCVRRWYSAKREEEEEAWRIFFIIFQEERQVAHYHGDRHRLTNPLVAAVCQYCGALFYLLELFLAFCDICRLFLYFQPM